MTLTRHPEYEKLIAIAEGKQMQRFMEDVQRWGDVLPQTALGFLAREEVNHAIRIKPRTMTINGHEFPEPMREAPGKVAEYWLVHLAYPDSYNSPFCWRGEASDHRYLDAGICQSTRQGAIDCAKALLSLLEQKS